MSKTVYKNLLPKNLLEVIELISISIFTELSLTLLYKFKQNFTELKKV